VLAVQYAMPSTHVSPTQSTFRPFMCQRATMPSPAVGWPLTSRRPYTLTSTPGSGFGSLTQAVTKIGGMVGTGVDEGAGVAGGGRLATGGGDTGAMVAGGGTRVGVDTAMSGVVEGDGGAVGVGVNVAVSDIAVGVDSGEMAVALREGVISGLPGRVGLGATSSLDATVASGLTPRVGVPDGLTVRVRVGSGPGRAAHAVSVAQSRTTRVRDLFMADRIG
jgi:hypothetical protein